MSIPAEIFERSLMPAPMLPISVSATEEVRTTAHSEAQAIAASTARLPGKDRVFPYNGTRSSSHFNKRGRKENRPCAPLLQHLQSSLYQL